MTGSDPPWLALDDVERRYTTSQVRAMCAELRPPRTRSHHDVTDPQSAAGLVPVVDADGQAAVLLTQRPSTMRYHRGDWVFALPNGDQVWGTQGEILYDLLEQLAILRRADLDAS